MGNYAVQTVLAGSIETRANEYGEAIRVRFLNTTGDKFNCCYPYALKTHRKLIWLL